MMARERNEKGFTLIEIITVVAIVGMLTLVAIVIFVRAKSVSQRNTCIANLHQLQATVNIWALNTGAGPETKITKETLVPEYIKVWPKEGTAEYPIPENIKALPVCPNAEANPDHKL